MAEVKLRSATRLDESGYNVAGFPHVAGATAMTEQHNAHRLLEALRAEQQQRWQQGERVPVEAYFEQHPWLQADGEWALELIYHEVLLREQVGEKPQVSEYQQRF